MVGVGWVAWVGCMVLVKDGGGGGGTDGEVR